MRNNDALREELSRVEVKEYLKSVANHKLLSPKVSRQLIQEAQDGSILALQKIIKHNMKLVIKIASNYVGRGVSLVDLCQEGALGIKPAIMAFKLSKGTQFSTYATQWIRKMVGLALTEQKGSYKVPFSYTVLANKALTVKTELEMLVCRECTINELAAVLEVSPNKLNNAICAVQGSLSIHSPIANEFDNEITLEDVLPGTVDVGKEIEDKELATMLDNVLENYLNPQELYAIKYMNGYYNQKPKFDKLGELLSVTQERARQIFEKGKKKLKNPDIKELVGDVL